MKNLVPFVLLALLVSIGIEAGAQSMRPELMYFRFDASGQSTVPNMAAPATRVSTSATLNGGMTQGSTGQFGTALIGTGGSSSSDYVSTGWSPNLGNSSWTISLWFNNIPSTTSLQYFFGDNDAGSWRAFTGGVAGAGNVMLRGPVEDITVNNISGSATVVHFVYDATAGQILGYRNGVLQTTVTQSAINITSTGDFKIGGYSSNDGLPNGSLIDEFRMYNRALSATEIAMSWDKSVLAPPAPNDAGIASIDSPLDFCAGTLPVTVTLVNYGSNQLTSATINWEMNGVAQTPYSWSGTLDTNDISSRSTQVTLGNYTFNSNVPYAITVWTESPNGVQDTTNYNDTVAVVRKAAISGTMSIGPSGDYTNFTDAIDDLVTNGVCGPVVYRVAPGTYTEQIELNEINGASAVNTITFESFTGNNNDVILEYSASSSANYTVYFNGADHITMKNMTIRALNASYSHVIEVEGGAEYNTLDNLILEGMPSTSTSTNRAVLYSSDDEDNYWTVKNCRFLNGSSAVYWEGSSSSSLESGTVFENNVAENFYYYGMRFAYQNAPYVKGNEIKSNTTYTSYGLYMYYCDNAMRVLGNSIFYNGSGSKYGLRLYYCDASTGAEGITANNFVTIDNGSSTAYGLYIYYADYQKVYFNTSYVNSTSSSGRAIYTYYGDDVQLSHNIGYNAGSGYAWYNYPSSGSNILASDYNVFYTNGSSLAYYSGGAVADLPALQAASGTNANSIEKNVYFADPTNGDLHLVSPSEDDTDLHGMLLPEVTEDIDGDNRIVPFRGADEACYIVDGSIWFDFVNASGDPKPYVNVPGQIGVRYHVEFPEFDSDITITLNFYSVPGNSLVYTTQLYVQKQFGVTLDGYTMVNIDNIAEGFYRVEAVFNTKNSCGGYRDYIPADNSILAMQNGATPCVVWPGDVNNDGIANYADKKALAGYIHDANLNPLWLNGPSRFRADASVNPLTYLEWKPQASLPWSTPEGCYMDCDGNGVVNTFDNILFKKNWMRTHGAFQAKDEDVFSAATFDMSRNFPNPFNPSTTINYSVPERSHVQIIVTDMMGREVATLVNETVEAGVRSLTFDAANLPSGVYVATASMQGTETGLTFTKTIRMTLSK